MVENGQIENIPAPQLAINYYKLETDAKLSDLIRSVRADELRHSVTNYKLSENIHLTK
jgi:ubiquinol oxidase